MISGSAFGEEPLSGIPDADDVSFENPLTGLLSDPHAELAFMLRARPYDRTIGAEVDVCLSTHGYATLNDGGSERAGLPDHTHFPHALSSAYNVKVNLLSGGGWQPSAVPGYGAIAVANPDGVHDPLLALDWELRDVTVWVGRYQWIGPSFKHLGKVFSGTVERISWDDGKILLHVRDLRQLFEQDVNPEAYLGFGTAVRLRGAGDKVTVPFDASLNTTASGQAILFYETMLEVAVLHQGVLATQGGSAGWSAWLFADGAVGLFSQNEARAVSNVGVVRAGRPVRLSFVGSAAGLLVYADGLVVASSGQAYVNTGNASGLILGAGA